MRVPDLKYRTVAEWLADTQPAPQAPPPEPRQEPVSVKLRLSDCITPRGSSYNPRTEQTRDTRTVTAAYLIDLVARAHGVTPADLKTHKRSESVVAARAEAMALVWMMRRDMTTPQIARLFERSDHTTVLHALRKAGLL